MNRIEGLRRALYAQVLSRCGRLHFRLAGTHRVTLQPLDIQSNSGVGLALVEVRLRRD